MHEIAVSEYEIRAKALDLAIAAARDSDAPVTFHDLMAAAERFRAFLTGEDRSPAG